MYQTRGRVFHPISKHRQLDWKNEAQPIFLTNFEVFVNRIKHSFECLVWLLKPLIITDWRNSKQKKFYRIKIKFSNLFRSSDLLCLFMNY